MIRMVQSDSAADAKAYFTDALAKADYYLDDQELNGKIQGKLAERLGITGPATKEVFFALCDNVDPKTGQQLTPRMKEERRTGYDINFHCPKSVSILHALATDDHMVKAFEASVRETMLEMQADAKTRVRKNGVSEDRETGEMVWADFVHQTARPVDGSAPDPHLHAHCFVFNATWDEAEKKIKAAQLGDIKRDMPYYQSLFHKRLSDNLINLGYQIKRNQKSFEVEGVPERVIDLFSKRTDAIGRFAKENNITDVKELAELGARTRNKKQKGFSMSELKEEWKRQILELGPEKEGKGEKAVRFAPEKSARELTPEQCIDHAISHGFERASVMQDRRLLEAGIKYSIGNKSVSIESVKEAFQADQRIIQVREKNRMLCTTRAVLREEKIMVDLARQGQGKMWPLYKQAPELQLKGQQAEAVNHVLTTKDQISIVKGGAGTGKTTLMQEANKHIENAGKQMMVVAPTAGASRGVLREEGFKQAETVAKLLVDKDMQDQLENQVLWVDEAGLLGTTDMTRLLELVRQKNARIILGGDTRQHSAVIRGDALRILNTVAGIRSAEVSRIYRQKQNNYREAVADLAKGAIHSGFEKLDEMGSIHTIDPKKPNESLVDDYVACLKKGKSALVVSPTHAQANEVTKAIRERLQKDGKLGKRELKADQLKNLNLTEAEKSDGQNFREGQVIQFNQNMAKIKRGSVWTVGKVYEDVIEIMSPENKKTVLPIAKSKFYDVFEKGEILLAKNDQLRITRNGWDEDGKRLDNGDLLEVVSVKKTGEIVARNTKSNYTYKLNKDFSHLAHSYCITSHASQGKTVDEVFITQPAATFPGTDSKQFYVSVSRGRDAVHIYTDDKEELLRHASQIGDRQSAIELVGNGIPATDHTQQIIRQDMERQQHEEMLKKQAMEITTPIIDQSYEPRI